MPDNHRCKVVVLISGSGSNLQALIDHSKEADCAYQLMAVISNQSQAYGLQRAEQAGLPQHCLQHTDFESREAFDEALQQLIDRYQPQLVVLAGFMRILSAGFVRHYHGRMLNIHPSLLPKYRGLHTHQRVLDSGDNVHGVSVHFVTEELDGGPVILQSQVPVLPEDNAETLAARVQKQEHIIYPLVVDWYATRRLQMHNNTVLFDDRALDKPLVYQDLIGQQLTGGSGSTL